MSCVTSPQTVEDFFSLISRCATQYGGARWQETALLGLATAALIGLTLILLLIGLTRVRDQ